MSRSPPHPAPLPSQPSQTATKTLLTLLPQLGLSLLHGRDNHVTNTSVRETVQVGARAVRLDNEERLGAAVVRAVENGSGGETHGHPELVARGTRACSGRRRRDIRVQGEQDCSETTRIDGERTSMDQQTSPVSISSRTISLTSSDVPRFDILLEDLL